MSDSAKTQPLAPDDAAESSPAGMRLGRYIVIGRLGEGGVGEVFRAYDPQLDRKVAVKRLHGTGARAAALLREAKLLARLNHPNIVTVYDVGLEGERAYLAMELVDGADLSQWLHAHGTDTPWRAILRMLAAAGEGLAAAHAHGIVHGDIKPANILVGVDGRVRVGDFGV
ncbi:MAG TPA: serine/threonine-protein kinase, partial [Nannocystaceae bacterium]|nr:serine/threonine-protein kinase [Nannocystaceae bacterium]